MPGFLLKTVQYFSIYLPRQPEFWWESNSLKNFWRRPCQDHFCEVFFKSNGRFHRRCLMHARFDGLKDGCTTDTRPWHKLASFNLSFKGFKTLWEKEKMPITIVSLLFPPQCFQSSHIHQSNVYWRIKISQSIFEKGFREEDFSQPLLKYIPSIALNLE